jgi:hypothetical protein
VPTTTVAAGRVVVVAKREHVAAKLASQRGCRHLLYVLTRINVGLSPEELYEIALYNRSVEIPSTPARLASSVSREV